MSVVDLGADALYGRLGEFEFDVKELLTPLAPSVDAQRREDLLLGGSAVDSAPLI